MELGSKISDYLDDSGTGVFVTSQSLFSHCRNDDFYKSDAGGDSPGPVLGDPQGPDEHAAACDRERHTYQRQAAAGEFRALSLEDAGLQEGGRSRRGPQIEFRNGTPPGRHVRSS